MDATQIKRIFRQWLEIREQNGISLSDPLNVSRLIADIEHSALLDRLLSGQKALREAPPRHWAYPWYELIEENKGEPFEVSFPPYNNSSVSIDQYIWNIVKKHNDDYIISFKTSKTRWLLSKKEKWMLKFIKLCDSCEEILGEKYFTESMRTNSPIRTWLFFCNSQCFENHKKSIISEKTEVK